MWSFQEVCNAIIETKKAGKRVIAVGTTSVRSVETAALSAEENGNPDLIEPYFSDTSIFIYLQIIPCGGCVDYQFPLTGKYINYVGVCLRRL